MVAYSFKRQFVEPIQVGLGLLPTTGRIIDAPTPRGYEVVPAIHPKRQTIRGFGKRRHAKAGDELQLYSGMRTKNCFLIGRARCIDARRITLYFTEGSVAAMINGKPFGPRKMRDFARADGFKDALEMAAFWSHENGTRNGDKWTGVLITWEPLS